MSINRTALALASPALPERINAYLLEKISKPLKAQFCDKLTDDFLQFLLEVMEAAFILSPGYRENIQDFQGTLVFGTADQGVAVTAVFDKGRMKVDKHAVVPSNVRVTFTDAKALWSYLLSEGQDVLNSVLENTVEVEGNLNYLYRFGFLARDLTRRIGVA
jgi:hypothetical protein